MGANRLNFTVTNRFILGKSDEKTDIAYVNWRVFF
jgi:hypothetical protein